VCVVTEAIQHTAWNFKASPWPTRRRTDDIATCSRIPTAGASTGCLPSLLSDAVPLRKWCL
jgi:hypothetical protein